MANMQLTKTPMAEQDPQVRNQNFLEVAQGYTLEEAMNEAKRCIHCLLYTSWRCWAEAWAVPSPCRWPRP